MAARTIQTAMLAAAMTGLITPVSATVHAVAMYMRTGERTPIVGPDTVRLTTVGAQQAFSQGEMFRSRYIQHGLNDSNPFAPIFDFASETADPEETYIIVPDAQYMSASAQAFMQAFYPPYAPVAENISDLSMILSDDSTVTGPLNGYVYPLVHTVSALDPNSIYVAGSSGCLNWAQSAAQYTATDDFSRIQNQTKDMYGMIGIDTLAPVFPEDTWGYYNAYPIYDYVKYEYEHNATVFGMFNDTGSQAVLSELRWLADEHEWAVNGDLTANGPSNGDEIRAIAGKTLAAKMLGFLQNNVATSGETNKFNLIVGEYDPMVALFSLLSLGNLNSNFYGLPDFASVLVFELFSPDGNGDGDGPASQIANSNTTYPALDNLWVRFYFRNSSDYGVGLSSDPTDDSSDWQAYPIFARGPSETDMMWTDFENEMTQIMLTDVGQWCTTCEAYNVFCPAFVAGSGSAGSGSELGSSHGSSGLSPVVAGAIGAVVTLGVLLLAILLAGLLGVRFTRHPAVFGRKTSDLGGFKGGAKLASDQDLSIAKNGAAMGAGAVVTTAPSKGHERVGSWELREPTSPSSMDETLGKEIEAGWSAPKMTHERRVDRASFEAGEDHGFTPVQPRTSF